MGTTVQVTDQHGGSVKATRDIFTGYISVDIMNGKTGQEQNILVDPKEPEVDSWLRKVFQPIHLEILLES